MPTVPRKTTPETQRQSVNVLPRGTGAVNSDAFGGAMGRALQSAGRGVQQIGSALMQGAARLKNRQDAVARARDFNTFRGNMRDYFIKETTERHAFGDDESLQAYSDFANQQIHEILANHRGSTTSRLALSEMLTQERGRFTDAAVTEALKTQRAMVDNTLQSEFSQHADMAAKAPELATSLMGDVDRSVAGFSGVLTPEQEDVARKTGYQTITMGALDTLLARGQFDKAEKVLDGSADFMDPQIQRQYRNRIIVTRATDTRERAALEARFRFLEDRYSEVGENVRLGMAAMGITLPKDVKTATDKMNEAVAAYKQQFGKDPTDAQASEMFQAIVLDGKAEKDSIVDKVKQSIDAWKLLNPDMPMTQEVVDGIIYKHMASRAPAGKYSVLDKVKDGIAAFEVAHGRQPNGEEKQEILYKFVQQAPSSKSQTLYQKVQDAKKAATYLGIEWTDQVANQVAHKFIMKDAQGDPLFGKSKEGRALSYLVELTPAFSEGTTNEFEDRLYIAAATAVMEGNKVTGIQGQLPPDVRHALIQRNINPDRLGELQGTFGGGGFTAPGQTSQPSASAPQGAPTGQKESTASGSQSLESAGAEHTQEVLQREIAGEGGKSAEGQQGVDVTQQMEAYEKQTRMFQETGGMVSKDAPKPPITLYESADLLTGITSTIRAGMAQTPVVGKILQAPEILRARRFMETWKKDLIRVLQNNPRYPEGERRAIEESVDIESRFLQEPQAFKEQLIGLDDALKFREHTAEQMAADPRTPQELRESALAVLSGIQAARDVIGAPPVFDSEAAAINAAIAGQLKPGSLYRLPDGSINEIYVEGQEEGAPAEKKKKEEKK